MTFSSSKYSLEFALEASTHQILGFIAEPKVLAPLCVLSSCVYAHLRDSGPGSIGASIWREAFYFAFWRPASFEVLRAIEMPSDFKWHQECVKRLRLRARCIRHFKDLKKENKRPFIVKPGWATEQALPDGTFEYKYSVHECLGGLFGGRDFAEAPDTVAVITARTSFCAGPVADYHSEHSDVEKWKSIWRTRLPGARRLRYYELQVLDAGAKGFIACGAVLAGQAPKLRTLGGQPGWGGMTSIVKSIGYHGDDGRLYPSPDDSLYNSEGKPFGPCFTQERGWDAVGAGSRLRPPLHYIHQVRDQALRVCGMGMDLDSNCFFYTVNGRLVGECTAPGVIPAECVAAIGLHSPGERVRINTGAQEFWFPIEWYSLSAGSVPRFVDPVAMAKPLSSESDSDNSDTL